MYIVREDLGSLPKSLHICSRVVVSLCKMELFTVRLKCVNELKPTFLRTPLQSPWGTQSHHKLQVLLQNSGTSERKNKPCAIEMGPSSDDSSAAEVSAEKCVGYMVMGTLKEPGEDTTELYNTSLWSPPWFAASYQRLLEDKELVLPSVFS